MSVVNVQDWVVPRPKIGHLWIEGKRGVGIHNLDFFCGRDK